VSDPAGHSGPTADEIAGLVSAERTAGEYVPLPDVGQPTVDDAADPASGDPGQVPPAESVVRGSGDAAIAAAEERAALTRWRDIADAPPPPIPSDTANVRHAPELHPDCRTLLPLVGVWRGTGLFGNDPDAKDPQFGQQITIAHDGRPFLTYESVSWLLGPDGAVIRPAAREVGYWRPQPDGSIELLVAHSEGRIEVFYGQPRSVASWALSTDVGWRTPTAPPVIGTTRLYGITPDGRLAYVEERAHSDIELAPHASAALERIAG
jgi:hypothetical protein